MILPKLPNNTKTAKRVQDAFGGLDRRPGSVNGAIRDAVNMTSDLAPMLASRPYDKKRANPGTAQDSPPAFNGLLSAGSLYEVWGTKLYKDNAEVTGVTLRDSRKVMCALGERVIIWPDKVLYDPRTDPDTQQVVGIKSLESTVTVSGLTFSDGTYNGEEAEMNTITHPTASFDWADYFNVGDAVEISGCTAEPRNNKTPIVREIEGNKLIFYENVFYYPGDDGEAQLQELAGDGPGQEEGSWQNGGGSSGSGTGSGTGTGTGTGTGSDGESSGGESGSGSNTLNGAETESGGSGSSETHSVTETGSVTVARLCPDLDFLCTNENRVWGCKGDTIWCSKLGDPYNWYAFDDVSTASWSVDSGTAGNFTGCIAFLGYPCFFKENKVFKVYGSRPQNFELLAGADVGVKAGCAGSMAIASGALFYLSPSGFMQWSGGLPSPIDVALGDLKITTAAGGSDGRKYWASLGAGSDWAGSLLCWDPVRKMWHREDADTAPMVRMERHGSALVMGNNAYLRLKGDWSGATAAAHWQTEDDFDSTVEFADFDGKTFDSKYPVRLWLRAAGWQDDPDDPDDAAATLTVYMSYDGGAWEKAAQYQPGKKGQTYFPVPIRRCGYWALKLQADGPWKLWALEQEYYAGKEARR